MTPASASSAPTAPDERPARSPRQRTRREQQRKAPVAVRAETLFLPREEGGSGYSLYLGGVDEFFVESEERVDRKTGVVYRTQHVVHLQANDGAGSCDCECFKRRGVCVHVTGTRREMERRAVEEEERRAREAWIAGEPTPSVDASPPASPSSPQRHLWSWTWQRAQAEAAAVTEGDRAQDRDELRRQWTSANVGRDFD